MSGDEIRALLDEGKLFGFNIAASNTGRSTVRILTNSIEHYGATKKPFPAAWPEVFKLILPHSNAAVPGTELQRCLNCDSGHVLNLVRGGFLRVVHGTAWRRGCGGSPSVTRESFEAFLKGRQLGVPVGMSGK